MVTKLGYGTGHILNDMCASMWFTYMLLFFHNVIQLSNTNAGLIVLIGQIADGISTVLVGVLSDQEHNIWIYIRYGKRKVSLKAKHTNQTGLNIIYIYCFEEYLNSLLFIRFLIFGLIFNKGMAFDGNAVCPHKLPVSILASYRLKH